MAARLSRGVFDDLRRIYARHFNSLRGLGESPAAATDAARRRVQGLAALALALDNHPDRGAARDDVLPGMRVVATDRAEVWYKIGPEAIDVVAILPEETRARRAMLTAMLEATS